MNYRLFDRYRLMRFHLKTWQLLTFFLQKPCQALITPNTSFFSYSRAPVHLRVPTKPIYVPSLTNCCSHVLILLQSVINPIPTVLLILVSRSYD